jgi:hypothetical protein
MAYIDQKISIKGRLFLVSWCVFLILMFVFAGIFSVNTVDKYRSDAALRHEARINPHAVEPGKTAADDKLPEGANPKKVKVGIYMDGISEISVLDSYWNPTFYIWFTWQGDIVNLSGKKINPGETFKIVDGEIIKREKLVDTVVGDQHYSQFLVKARLTKFFTSDRYPLDDHLPTLSLEDSDLQWKDLEFVPDNETSNISSRVKMPGYSVFKFGLVMKPHSYKSSFGIEGMPKESKATFSQLICGIWTVRPGLGPYLKTFLGLFAAILIAMLALFIKPTDVDPRFGLGIGGFFGAVANMLLSVSMVPDSGVVTLMNLVNGLGVITIALSMIQSTISLHLFDIRGQTTLSRYFDRLSFAVMATGCVAINILIPMFAWTSM